MCIHNHICEIASYVWTQWRFFANMQDMLAATLPDIESGIYAWLLKTEYQIKSVVYVYSEFCALN